MNKGGRPVGFDLEEMLELRRKGWSFKALGFKYGKDHTTMVHHCHRNNVHPEGREFRKPKRRILKRIKPVKVVPKIEKPVWKPKPQEPKVDKYAEVYDYQERPSTRSYASYLKEALKRPVEKHYMDRYRLI